MEEVVRYGEGRYPLQVTRGVDACPPVLPPPPSGDWQGPALCHGAGALTAGGSRRSTFSPLSGRGPRREDEAVDDVSTNRLVECPWSTVW